MTSEQRTLTLQVGETGASGPAAASPIELVLIPPGAFTMGSPTTEPGHAANEEPARRVRLTKAFYLGRYEVTRAQYRAVMGAPAWEGPVDPAADALPQRAIRYADALEFCRRLSAMSGRAVRLPTEAEWEHACRAGTDTPYGSGSTEADLARVGWYDGNSGGDAHPVGQKAPNAFGLYDMHGNVWELCGDLISDYATMSEVDPVGRTSPTHGAMRGGGYLHDADDARSASRLVSDDMFGGAGFRVAVSVD